MTRTVPDEFRALMQALIRGFGLLAADRTPCGKPLASSDAHALMLLLDAGEDGVLSSVLATRLGIDKSTASRVVARLTEVGHVAAAPGTDDARAKPIRLTKKGVRVATEVQLASQDRFARLLENVSPRRRRDVVTALQELVSALEKMTSNSEDKDHEDHA
ncbi:MAG: MarR family winged helix-turn-helix transcriptional regulator [Deltaproteobacteria bacterium]